MSRGGKRPGAGRKAIELTDEGHWAIWLHCERYRSLLTQIKQQIQADRYWASFYYGPDLMDGFRDLRSLDLTARRRALLDDDSPEADLLKDVRDRRQAVASQNDSPPDIGVDWLKNSRNVHRLPFTRLGGGCRSLIIQRVSNISIQVIGQKLSPRTVRKIWETSCSWLRRDE